MRIADMDWQMVEDWVRHDDRAALPLGSTEQHAACRCSPTPSSPSASPPKPPNRSACRCFRHFPLASRRPTVAFPGSITLRVATLCAVVRDVLDSLKHSGFRRILIVNGHAENSAAASFAQEWMMDNPDCRVRFHDWWRAPQTRAQALAIAPDPTHANWSENFPWTRLPGTPTEGEKRPVDRDRLRTLPPFEVRSLLEDGSYGGRRARSDGEMAALWQVAVAETRALLEQW